MYKDTKHRTNSNKKKTPASQRLEFSFCSKKFNKYQKLKKNMYYKEYIDEFGNFIRLPRNIPTKTGNIYSICWDKLIRFFNDDDLGLVGYHGFGKNVLDKITEISVIKPYDYICHLVIYIMINEYVIEKACKEHGLSKHEGRKNITENYFKDFRKWDNLLETLYNSTEKYLVKNIKIYTPGKPHWYLICNMKIPDLIVLDTQAEKSTKKLFDVVLEKELGKWFYYFGFGPARKIQTSPYWIESSIRNKKQHISTNDPTLIKKLSKYSEPKEVIHPFGDSFLIVSTFSFEQNFEPLDLACEYISNKI